MLFHDICWPVYFKFATRGCDRKPPCSLRASSPIWASEASLSRTRERAAKPRGARLTSLTQIGELARRLATMRNQFYLMRQKSFNTINRLIETFIIPSRDNICVLISEKRANSRKNVPSSQDLA